MRNPDRDFSNQFWQALIFDQYDDPGTLRGQEARRLRQHLNVYIQMIDERGEVVFSSSERDYMVRTIPVAARSITGATYDGRIEVGHSVRGEQRDWIKIEVVDHHESASSTTCALAWVGAEAGHIWLIRDQYRQCDFPALFIHEFGHAYGLWHVGDPSSVMFPRDNGIRQFSGSDRYHAQLAYRELQRGRDLLRLAVRSGVRQSGYPCGRQVGTTPRARGRLRSVLRGRNDTCDHQPVITCDRRRGRNDLPVLNQEASTSAGIIALPNRKRRSARSAPAEAAGGASSGIGGVQPRAIRLTRTPSSIRSR